MDRLELTGCARRSHFSSFVEALFLHFLKGTLVRKNNKILTITNLSTKCEVIIAVRGNGRTMHTISHLPNKYLFYFDYTDDKILSKVSCCILYEIDGAMCRN